MPKDMIHAETVDPDTCQPRFREPVAEDGAAIWELVRRCEPLDQNSVYCNLIQASQFAGTCVVAEIDGRIAGWISGHMIPGEDAVFVWQVAVCPSARGLGLGGRMLDHLIRRPACREATLLRTTITRANAASWGLFESFARRIGGDLTDKAHFRKDTHFDGRAPTEHLVTITLPRRHSALRAVA